MFFFNERLLLLWKYNARVCHLFWKSEKEQQKAILNGWLSYHRLRLLYGQQFFSSIAPMIQA